MATVPLPAIASGPAEAAHSGIREVVNLALVTPGCIRLEVGEPNFPTPSHIVDAAIEFARKGQVKYTATAGLHPAGGWRAELSHACSHCGGGHRVRAQGPGEVHRDSRLD